jgi:tetratricopeptide (TPR) repeat protein
LALDRDDTLKKAEKLLRQGRLDGAIAEYVKLVEDQPRDWNTANALGDLYARGGQTDLAVGQYSRIAEHFMSEGFYPKAAALYKKILKINKDDEPTQLQLAEISARQGLLADAKSHLNAVAARRKSRGDRRGEAEIVVRLGEIDPADFDARRTSAETLEQMGEEDAAAERYKALHADLLEKDRTAEALDALRALIRLRPFDAEARAALAKSAIDAGDLDGAREFLDRDTAGSDPSLLMALVDLDLRAGALESARQLMPSLLKADYGSRHKLLEIGESLGESSPDAAYACVDAVVDAAVAASDFQEAATTLQTFVGRVPGQITALLKLVEICVDGGFESAMYEAQVLLTDAYLEAGQASEARVIAEDLVAREPWEAAHMDRFRRALVMLRVPDPDTEIAERLSGQAPFMATDPFVDPSDLPPPPPPLPESAPEAASNDAAVAAAPADAPAGDAADSVYKAVDPSAAAVPTGPPIAFKPSPPVSRTTQEIDLTGELSTLHDGGDRELGARERESWGPGSSRGHDSATADSGSEPPPVGGVPDFSAQHMTLARTYLEMGMTEQAEAALRTAAEAPRLRFEAGSLLGRIMRARGDVPQALEWLERASEAPPTSPEEGRELMYDFGVTLDEAGETARALAVFLELQSEAGDYRDVPERIDRLARVQSGG